MKFIANPVEVDAYPIEAMTTSSNLKEPLGFACILVLTGAPEGMRLFKPTPEMLSRIRPDVGDYVVVQSDGYVYLNPKAVFERKYKPAPAEALDGSLQHS
jgi:hypothetical protein